MHKCNSFSLVSPKWLTNRLIKPRNFIITVGAQQKNVPCSPDTKHPLIKNHQEHDVSRRESASLNPKLRIESIHPPWILVGYTLWKDLVCWLDRTVSGEIGSDIPTDRWIRGFQELRGKENYRQQKQKQKLIYLLGLIELTGWVWRLQVDNTYPQITESAQEFTAALWKWAYL